MDGHRCVQMGLMVVVMCVCAAPRIEAQGWVPDARAVALGGIGGAENVFTSTVDEARGDRSIVIPLGLIQMLLDRNVLNPKSPKFDPARALEYGTNPMHFTFGRRGSTSASDFVTGLRNGSLQRDLNAYRGFVPADISGGALATPKWGYTFTLAERAGVRTQGLYVGGGPHLSMQTSLAVDSGLRELLDSDAAVYAIGQRFGLRNSSAGQAAVAATAGYRGHYQLRDSSTGAPATAFFIVNGSYLYGLRYEDVDIRLRLDTGGDGLLVDGATQAPLNLARVTSTRGSGMSFDVGGGVDFGMWQVGLSANGLGNRMTWRGVESRDYWLNSLTRGNGGFLRSAPAALSDRRVVTPVGYKGNVAFRSSQFSALAQIDRDWDRTFVHGGFELDTRYATVRAAVTRGDRTWFPSGGFSVPVAPRLWVDAAVFSTTANVERERRIAAALSLRIVSAAPRTEP